MRHEATTPATRRFFAYLNLFLFAMLVLVLARELPPDVRGLGGRGALLVPPDRLLLREGVRRRRRQEGVRRQPDRRLRLPARHVRRLRRSSARSSFADGLRGRPRRIPAAYAPCADDRLPLPLRRRHAARARRSRCTSGCRTPWPARRPSPRSSTPRRWSRPASTWWPAATCSSASRPTRCSSWPVVGCVHGALRRRRSRIAQNDIKKVLAYSTVSQLGYMFLACGVGAFTRGHVPRHDARVLQGLPLPRVRLASSTPWRASRTSATWAASRRRCPITYWTFLDRDARDRRASRRFAGFFSKDAILAERLRIARALGQVFWAVGLFTAGLTAFYMFRARLPDLPRRFRGTPEQEHHLHESPRR